MTAPAVTEDTAALVHLVADPAWETLACGLSPDSDGPGRIPPRATGDPAQVTCTACAAVPPAAVLTGPDALRLARQVGIAHKRAMDAKDAYEAVRLRASAAFAVMRRRGIPSQEIRLPGGEKVALITIEQGGSSADWDMDLLQAVAAGNDPRDFEDYADVRAFTDPRVIRLLAEHFPALVGRRLRADVLARYKAEALENGGQITERATGERVPVAVITQHEPTGKFSVRFSPKGRQLLQDALDSGAVSERGESDEDENEAAASAGETQAQ